MGQVQQYFLEGMRPEQSHMNFSVPRNIIQPPPQIQKTYTIRNDVNLKKKTMRLVRDAASSSRYHLEFAFDVAECAECSITVHYAALEDAAGASGSSFTPLKPSSSPPVQQHGQGLGQSYRSDASHPLDVAKYAASELSHAPCAPGSTAPERFPLVVCLKAGAAGAASSSAVQSQTTFADLVAQPGGGYTVLPLKQKIQVGSHAYELQEIYGIEGGATEAEGGGGGAADEAEGDENTRECVICMTEARDTTVLPCRHMCMCYDCAKVLRVQSNKCPICRTNIDSLLQIKISGQSDAAPSAEEPVPLA